jgi:hypothetical protein
MERLEDACAMLERNVLVCKQDLMDQDLFEELCNANASPIEVTEAEFPARKVKFVNILWIPRALWPPGSPYRIMHKFPVMLTPEQQDAEEKIMAKTIQKTISYAAWRLKVPPTTELLVGIWSVEKIKRGDQTSVIISYSMLF